MTTRYKAGSRVQTAWEKYKAEGATALLGAAVALNIKPSTAKGWARMWDKEAGKVPEPQAKGNGTPTGPIVMHTKKLITVNYVKAKGESQAYLIEQGPQASVVRFKHNGSEQCIGNDQLGLPVIRAEAQPIRRD